MEEKTIRRISENRKARHHYTISDQYEAGIVLVGSEVKSIRSGQVNLKDSYARFSDAGELFVHQVHINPYKYAYNDNHDPLRKRKLLLNKSEIRKLKNKVNEKGFSIIPLSLYFKGSKIKMKIGIAKGKNLYDKRHALKEKDSNMQVHRANKFHEY